MTISSLLKTVRQKGSTCRIRPALSIAVMLSLAWLSRPLVAQEAEPPDFSTLTAEQLIAEAAQLKESGDLTTDLARAVGKRSIDLLNELGETGAANSVTISLLAKLAEPALDELTPEQRQSLADTVGGGLFDPNDEAIDSLHPSFDWLHFHVSTIEAGNGSRESSQTLVEAWINEVGIDNLSVEMTRWSLEQLLPNDVARREFSVTWTGNITPPRGGEYTFSVSPINVNSANGSATVEHAISVTIAGAKVIDAAPSSVEQVSRRLIARGRSRTPSTESNWNWKSEPVGLQQGVSVPIRVEMSYRCEVPDPGSMPSAILNWQTAGVSRRPVPSDALTSPDGREKGLRAEFHWREGSRNIDIVQSIPNIDFVWATPEDIAPSNLNLVEKLADRLWTLATDDEYLRNCSDGTTNHVFLQHSRSAQRLTSAQRRRFVEMLAQNRKLLEHVSQQELLRVYRQFRFGAEDQAMDLLSTWMELNADIAPKIALDFFDENRQTFAELAFHLTQQLPDAYRELERNLAMPDGRCSLPVAYVLAYAYPMSGNYRGWFEFLAEKLDDESLVGDPRVNWLLARAMAAESTHATLGQRSGGRLRLSSANDWLDEADLVAEDPNTRLRIWKERIARMVARHRWSDAEQELATQQAPPEWRQQVAQLKKVAQRKAENERKLSAASFVAELERRLELAREHQNQAQIEHYQRLVDNATEENKN